MRANPYLVQTLKYASITVAVVVVCVALASVLGGGSGSIAGRLVAPQESGGVIPTLHYTAEQAMQGFTIPTDTHVIFVVPNSVRIPRLAFLGGADVDEVVRYWGYCFSGNEQENKEEGLRGKGMYDGRFFYSLAERQQQLKRPKPADSDLIGIKNASTEPGKTPLASIAEIFEGGQTCYIMVDGSTVSGGLPAGLDTDGDNLNNMREVALGTNPSSMDTDQDGLSDVTEVLKSKSDPRIPDSDRDGLADGCEDKNRDGVYDKGETSPLVADTDRDKLCDGNGFAAACPEPKQTVCYQSTTTDRRDCQARPSSPVYGEDMNQNCKVDEGETDPANPATFGLEDWQYKWNAFQAKQRIQN